MTLSGLATILPQDTRFLVDGDSTSVTFVQLMMSFSSIMLSVEFVTEMSSKSYAGKSLRLSSCLIEWSHKENKNLKVMLRQGVMNNT